MMAEWRFSQQTSEVSEIILQAELNAAWCVGLRGDLTEGAQGRDVTTRSSPAYRVQYIEELAAELQALPFSDRKALAERSVEVKESGCALGPYTSRTEFAGRRDAISAASIVNASRAERAGGNI